MLVHAPAVSSVAEGRAVQTELIRCYPNYVRSFVGALEEAIRRNRVAHARHTGPAVDLPPLDVPGCFVVRCRDGRIVEARLYHPTGARDPITDRTLGRD